MSKFQVHTSKRLVSSERIYTHTYIRRHSLKTEESIFFHHEQNVIESKIGLSCKRNRMLDKVPIQNVSLLLIVGYRREKRNILRVDKFLIYGILKSL